MSGQTKKYERYLQILDSMEEPVVPKAKLDMRGALQLAKEKGVRVAQLAQNERDRFIVLL